MNEKPPAAPPPGMTLGDILYILFRHKWKILVVAAVAVIATLLLPVVRPAAYQSEARLYIRYVLESTAPSPGAENDTRIKSPDMRGDSLVNTELQILTSYDVAQQVADAVGPERILGIPKGMATRERAALTVQKNLLAEPAKNSSVIHVVFKHGDSQVVQPVLQSLIDSYFKKHAQMHAVGAFDEFLTQETDQLRARVTQAEEELKKAKEKAGVLSLPDSKKAYTELISKIRQELLDAEAELADRQASVKAMENLVAGKSVGVTNAAPSTNQVVVPPEILAEYKQVSGVLDTLEKREQELLTMFTPESPRVKEVREQLAANRDRRQKLEETNPGLAEVKVLEPKVTAGGVAVDHRAVINTELAKVAALQSRIKVLTTQMDTIRKEASATQEAEMTINELQRRLDLEEGDYKRFSESLRQSRIDERVGAGKVSNISIIQAPSPPLQDKQKLFKAMMLVLFGGFAAALAIPFLIELYLDQSIKRPVEVEKKLGLPLFLSIPRLALNGKSNGLVGSRKTLLLTQNGGAARGTQDHPHPPDSGGQPTEEAAAPAENASATGGMAPWDSRHAFRPFAEALRDRLITFFETRNMTHKPKLVAVTSCAGQSGVSTIAASLAASLSETGEGNVLLVDMNARDGAARQFHKGDLACGLDVALEADKRGTALVQDNLYVVTERGTDERLPSVLPRQFKHLVPKLKASDYDYIIFDMPSVSQISPTPRLARFMDMVLMVVEAEKTASDVVKRASSLLAESKTNVGVVLNKSQSHVPRFLQQEL